MTPTRRTAALYARNVSKRKRAPKPRVKPMFTYSAFIAVCEIPVLTVSEANQRGLHWAAKHSRKKAQQLTTLSVLNAYGPCVGDRVWRRITLVRLGAQKLDADNLAGAFKHVQDSIARWLGVDDRNVDWTYEQIAPADQHGVRIIFHSEVGK